MGPALRVSRRLSVLVATVLVLSVTSVLGPQSASAAPSLHYLFGSGSTHGDRAITLRVELTEPAPAGGALVRMRSERPDIIPVEDVTIPAGQTELTFAVDTNPILSDSYIRVTASYGGRTVGREVLVREPKLRALYLQSVIRAEGVGKLTVCLTGAAPTEGIAVRLSGDVPAALMVPETIAIAPGDGCRSIAMPAGAVTEDTQVLVSARYQGVSRFRDTVVRTLGDPVTATPTETSTATPSATSTSPVQATATMTATSTSSATATTAATSTATATITPSDELTITLASGSATVIKGSIVSFAICLAESPATQAFVSFSSNNLSVALDEEIVPTQWIVPAGASGDDLCASVAMTGRTSGPEHLGIGEVNLKANLGGVDYLSPAITFTVPAPTATETPVSTPSSTSTPTLTPTDAPTLTSTATETATPLPTSTATQTMAPTATATMVPTATATASETATATDTPLPTASHTSTATESPTATATETASPTATATTAPTLTATSTATQTPLPTATETSVPTATATETPLPTVTATQLPTETPTPSATATDIPAATSTATATSISTATATPTPTATIPAEPVVISLADGQSDTVEKGSTVNLSVCLSSSEPQARFLSYRSSDEIVALSDSIIPANDVFAPGECRAVTMTGRTSGPGSPGVGQVQLIANLNAVDYFGPVVTFTEPTP